MLINVSTVQSPLLNEKLCCITTIEINTDYISSEKEEN